MTGLGVRCRAGAVGALLVVLLLVGAVAVSAPAAQAATTATGFGFDTCSAPSTTTMADWLNSPYRSVGVYIGGANRACADGNLSASWVTTVEHQGWDIVPTYVGLQAPCVAQPGLSPIDPTQAATQGSGAADDAAARAKFFGLPSSSPIYFDMEAYGTDPGCVTAVQQFLSAWTQELHVQGYLSGVYGSSNSTIANEASAHASGMVVPDAIWFANWNGTSNVFGDPAFANSLWSNHQRLHQFQANLTESWGGASVTIDQDYNDGPTVGPPASCVPGGSGISGAVPPAPQVAANSGLQWSAWTAVKPPPAGNASAPAVASWGPGRLDLFERGQDGNLWHRFSTDRGTTWSSWESLASPSGGMTCSPSAVSWSAGRVDVFVRGVDGALWHKWWDGAAWRGWESLGGALVSSPTVSSWAPGRLDIFVVGTDRAMWHTWWDGTAWRAFESLGGYLLQDPTSVSTASNRIDVFGLATANVPSHEVWNGSAWSGWHQDAPGTSASGPSVAAWGSGRLDLFYEAGVSGYQMNHDFSIGGAWYQDEEGGSLTSAPAALAMGPDHIDVFVRGGDGNLWHLQS